MATSLEQQIQQTVLQMARTVEGQLDAELEKLENLDEDDLEKLREKRLKEMKKQAQQKNEWLIMGHGEYSEIPEEKEFFDVTKKSSNVVCHFYKDDSPRCKIVDHHFKILCKSHIETKFCKLNVERSPFLTERLRIRIIPTIALIKDGKTKDYIVGFTDLGNRDDFSTDMLEWRIAQAAVINYSGNLLEPPIEGKHSKKSLIFDAGRKKKTIRGKEDDSNSDDSDF